MAKKNLLQCDYGECHETVDIGSADSEDDKSINAFGWLLCQHHGARAHICPVHKDAVLQSMQSDG